MENLIKIPLKVESNIVHREFVLAEPSGVDELVLVRNIPALAYNVAYGDLIQPLDPATGDFRLVRRSGQLTIRAFVPSKLDTPAITQLIDQLVDMKGIFEVGKNQDGKPGYSLLLLSVHVQTGFEKIENLMSTVARSGGQWEFGNVYDELGEPLGWWK